MILRNEHSCVSTKFLFMKIDSWAVGHCSLTSALKDNYFQTKITTIYCNTCRIKKYDKNSTKEKRGDKQSATVRFLYT